MSFNNKQYNRIKYLEGKYNKPWNPYEPCSKDRSKNSMRKMRLEHYEEFIDEIRDELGLDVYSEENLKYYLKKYSLNDFHRHLDYKQCIVALGAIFIKINCPRKYFDVFTNKTLKKYGVTENEVMIISWNLIKLLMNHMPVSPETSNKYNHAILEKQGFDYLTVNYDLNEDINT